MTIGDLTFSDVAGLVTIIGVVSSYGLTRSKMGAGDRTFAKRMDNQDTILVEIVKRLDKVNGKVASTARRIGKVERQMERDDGRG